MPMSPEGDLVEINEAASGPAAPDGRMMTQAAPGQATSTYRNGEFQMKSDFIRVNDKVEVSAQLSKSGHVIATGTATVIPGETAFVALSNGQMASIVPDQMAYIITRPTSGRQSAYAPG